MIEQNRRQFIKISSSEGVVGLIAPSLILSSSINTNSEVPLIIGEVTINLRNPKFKGGKLWSIWNTSHCFGVAGMLE